MVTGYKSPSIWTHQLRNDDWICVRRSLWPNTDRYDLLSTGFDGLDIILFTLYTMDVGKRPLPDGPGAIVLKKQRTSHDADIIVSEKKVHSTIRESYLGFGPHIRSSTVRQRCSFSRACRAFPFQHCVLVEDSAPLYTHMCRWGALEMRVHPSIRPSLFFSFMRACRRRGRNEPRVSRRRSCS